jgi:hypothetical protein
MVDRVRKRIEIWAAMILGLFAAFHNPHEDDEPAEESVTALHEGQRTQIAPPPAPPTVSMPLKHRFINAGPQPLGGIR